MKKAWLKILWLIPALSLSSCVFSAWTSSTPNTSSYTLPKTSASSASPITPSSPSGSSSSAEVISAPKISLNETYLNYGFTFKNENAKAYDLYCKFDDANSYFSIGNVASNASTSVLFDLIPSFKSVTAYFENPGTLKNSPHSSASIRPMTTIDNLTITASTKQKTLVVGSNAIYDIRVDIPTADATQTGKALKKHTIAYHCYFGSNQNGTSVTQTLSDYSMTMGVQDLSLEFSLVFFPLTDSLEYLRFELVDSSWGVSTDWVDVTSARAGTMIPLSVSNFYWGPVAMVPEKYGTFTSDDKPYVAHFTRPLHTPLQSVGYVKSKWSSNGDYTDPENDDPDYELTRTEKIYNHKGAWTDPNSTPTGEMQLIAKGRNYADTTPVGSEVGDCLTLPSSLRAVEPSSGDKYQRLFYQSGGKDYYYYSLIFTWQNKNPFAVRLASYYWFPGVLGQWVNLDLEANATKQISVHTDVLKSDADAMEQACHFENYIYVPDPDNLSHIIKTPCVHKALEYSQTKSTFDIEALVA